MPEIVIPNDFTPRPYQEEFLSAMDNGCKRAVGVWHRRGGKDLTLIHQTAKQALDGQPAVYWHFFPAFEHARRSIWEHIDQRTGRRLLEWCFPGFSEPNRKGSVVRRTNEAQMLVEFKNGSLWRLMGSDRADPAGAGPFGVTFSEYALCRPTIWDFVRPMLRENGGTAAFISTPRGKNHMYDIYQTAKSTPGWFASFKTVHDTGLTYSSNKDPDKRITAAEMLDEERAEGMADALIRQEYECDFTAANVGAVWGDLIERLDKDGRLQAWENQRDGVFTAWDLGHSDATAIWFFRFGKDGVEFIDFYENHSKPLSHYLDVLLDRAEQRGYRYEKHWLPHDARAKTLATGVSVLDLFLNWTRSFEHGQGAGDVAITPSLSLADGIQAARWLLQQNGTRIHARCGREGSPAGVANLGIEALSAYGYEWDDKSKTFSTQPRHDWSSHAADGFRYAGVVVKLSESMRKLASKPKPIVLETPADRSFSLEQLHAWRSQDSRRRR